jgi:hypothetical protein
MSAARKPPGRGPTLVSADGCSVQWPARLDGGLNAREHHMSRARRAKDEKSKARLVARARLRMPARLPVRVTLTRFSPGTVKLDDDNLRGTLKAVRDGIAAWLGVDDGGPWVRWEYEQMRGEWAARVTIEELEHSGGPSA